MKKIFLIGWKDVLVAFRDPAALILMLAAPFLLSLGLGAVSGRFSGNTSGLNNIPMVVVNLDGRQLGTALVALFQSKDLNGLVETTLETDPARARLLVDQDKTAAAIIIPTGFTNSIIPAALSDGAAPSAAADLAAVVKLVLYANPTRPTSVGVIKTILDQFLSQVETGRVGGNVVVSQLITSGLIQPAQAAKIGQAVGASQAGDSNPTITLNNITTAGKAVKLDVLAILAPGMALMFLMYTTTNGGRSLLAERIMGTLPRLLITPTNLMQVLGGKIFGIYLTGVFQMLILVGGCTLLFQLDWGDPLGVVALVLSAVAGAVGWGLIITAVARTPGQVGAIGSAVMLTFGILGGTFLNVETLPSWFRVISHISPNAWGVDGFNSLAQGASLADITGQIAGLWIMGAVLFAVAVILLRRRGFAQA